LAGSPRAVAGLAFILSIRAQLHANYLSLNMHPGRAARPQPKL
jgi:hypothetical protein